MREDWKVTELLDDAGTPPRPDYKASIHEGMVRAVVALVVLVVLCALLVLFAPEARPNELPESPTPKPQPIERYKAPAIRKPVSRPSVSTWLTVGTIAAVTFDGITTRQEIKNGNMELDPLARHFLGVHPTYARMIPLGAAEVIGAALLARRFPKMRWLQVGLIAGHTEAGIHNLTLQ
jgi:uncharacterized membrane protein